MSIEYQGIADTPIDAWKESLRRGFRVKASPQEPVAFVVSPMYAEAGNETNATSGGDPFGISGARIAKYKFRAYIVDENSQHLGFPNPCELATAGDVAGATSLASCFTMCYIFDDPGNGQSVSVNVGDLVQIKLKRTADNERDNLDEAEFLRIVSRSTSPTNPLAKSECQSIVNAFPKAKTHTYSGGGGRPKIAEYTGAFGATQTVTNGQFPEALQIYVDTTHVIGKNRQEKLCADVVDDFNKLAAAYFGRFKTKLVVNSGYRPYETQLRIKQEFTAKGRGRFAATPGTSPHGWGVAFDWNSGGYGTTRYKWMLANAPRFNFTNPSWARQGGSLPEPWHFEHISKGNIIQNIRRAKASDGKNV